MPEDFTNIQNRPSNKARYNYPKKKHHRTFIDMIKVLFFNLHLINHFRYSSGKYKKRISSKKHNTHRHKRRNSNSKHKIELIKYNLFIKKNLYTLDGVRVRRIWEKKHISDENYRKRAAVKAFLNNLNQNIKKILYNLHVINGLTDLDGIPVKRFSLKKIHRKNKISKGKNSNKSSLENKRRFKLFLYNIYLIKTSPEAKERKIKSIFEKIRTLNKYIVNSSTMLIFINIMMYLICQFVTVAVSLSNHIAIKLYYFRIVYLISDTSNLWTKSTILSNIITGPLVCFLLGIVFIIIFFNTKNKYLKIFTYWAGLNGINSILGGFLSGSITREGLGYFNDWMYIPRKEEVIYCIVSVLLMIYIGFSMTKEFLLTANSFKRINKKNRSIFITAQGLIPWIISFAFIMLLKYPNNRDLFDGKYWNDVISFAMIGLYIIPMYFKRKVYLISDNFNPDKKYSVSYRFLIFAIIFILIYRLSLNWGIEYVIFKTSLQALH